MLLTSNILSRAVTGDRDARLPQSAGHFETCSLQSKPPFGPQSPSGSDINCKITGIENDRIHLVTGDTDRNKFAAGSHSGRSIRLASITMHAACVTRESARRAMLLMFFNRL